MLVCLRKNGPQPTTQHVLLSFRPWPKQIVGTGLISWHICLNTPYHSNIMFDYYKVSKLQKKIFTLLYLAFCKIHVRMVFLLYFEASTATMLPQNPKSALCRPPWSLPRAISSSLCLFWARVRRQALSQQKMVTSWVQPPTQRLRRTQPWPHPRPRRHGARPSLGPWVPHPLPNGFPNTCDLAS
jgi:hypothetical protein